MDAGKDSLLRIRVSQEQSVSAYACENAEFFYLISGRMYMANAGQVTLLREGDFLVTPASQVHSFSARIRFCISSCRLTAALSAGMI